MNNVSSRLDFRISEMKYYAIRNSVASPQCAIEGLRDPTVARSKTRVCIESAALGLSTDPDTDAELTLCLTAWRSSRNREMSIAVILGVGPQDISISPDK